MIDNLSNGWEGIIFNMRHDYSILKNSHILIVDDMTSNVEFLTYIVQEAGFIAVSATNGDAALRYLQKNAVDLILLDVVMPVMDGFEVCEQLKQSARTRDIPIIFITGRDDSANIVRAFELGAVDYIVRPVQREEVVMRIRTHLLMRNLVSQLQQHNTELRQQKDKAEQATRLKDKFVSLVAHDLRGPFQSLLGYLELLRDDEEEPLTEKQKQAIGEIMQSGRRQLNMINEILDIGRLQTGNIIVTRRFFDANYLLGLAVDKVRLLAQQKHIRLDNQVPKQTRIYVDEFLFIEVLQNLLTNAIKFSYPHSSIEMTLGQRDPLELHIIDHGTGVSERLLPHLFTLGEKTSMRGTSGEQGTGFGLPYSYEIISAHQGQLRVQSVVGTGSCFTLQLPAIKPVVLVVDDDAVTMEIIGQYLAPLGIEIVTADSGEAAIAQMKRHLPHVIIADIYMPKMSGFELLSAVKSNRPTQHIPVILMTAADDTDEFRHYCFELGADDYVVKPLVSCDFLPRVRHFIG